MPIAYGRVGGRGEAAGSIGFVNSGDNETSDQLSDGSLPLPAGLTISTNRACSTLPCSRFWRRSSRSHSLGYRNAAFWKVQILKGALVCQTVTVDLILPLCQDLPQRDPKRHTQLPSCQQQRDNELLVNSPALLLPSIRHMGCPIHASS